MISAMYEGSRSSHKLAVRKSPSMPMLDIGMINVEKLGARCKTPTPTTPRKLKSAITLCMGILVCCTLVLVGLDPAKVAEEPWRGGPGRPRMRVTLPITWSGPHPSSHQQQQGAGGGSEPAAALEGMGMLFRRGTRAMPHLVVAHLAESTTATELRLFLRGLHRSGMPSHADVVLLFPFRPVPSSFLTVIHDEETSFQKLLESNPQQARSSHPWQLSVFNSAAYCNTQLLDSRQDSIWGAHRRHNESSQSAPELEPAAEPQYGAVVGFDVQELDADDALSGFLNSPPIHLRRWLCYQMLLGMVRHKYRHVLVTEVTGVVILADALVLKKRDSGQLHLFATTQKWSNSTIRELYGSGVWNALDEDKKRSLKIISSGVLLGGVRPVRAVATAMATEIVRVAMLRKKKDCFITSDSSLLSYLVHRSSALGRKVASHLQVHDSGSSTVNVLPSKSHDLFNRRNESRFALIQGLHTEDSLRHKVLESLRNDHCRELAIYTDCTTTTTTTT